MNSIQNLFNISEVGEAAVSSSSSGPASSLSAKMEAEGVRNGQVMFHPSDSFAVFVRAVESSVFAHLFETERDEAAEGKKPIKSSSSGGHERRAQQMNGASLSNREKDMVLGIPNCLSANFFIIKTLLSPPKIFFYFLI